MNYDIEVNIVNYMGDKILGKIVSLLDKNKIGLTITDLVSKTFLSRSSIRTALAKLEGAEKINFKKVGMAKLYFLKKGKNK